MLVSRPQSYKPLVSGATGMQDMLMSTLPQDDYSNPNDLPQDLTNPAGPMWDHFSALMKSKHAVIGRGSFAAGSKLGDPSEVPLSIRALTQPKGR